MGKKRYRIGIIPGDGIGRDVIKAARIVLDAIHEQSTTFALDFKPMDTGDAAVKKYGAPFPKETLDGIAATDAVLFGAAGNPHTVAVLMGFRLGFNLYANVRPVKSLPGSNALKTNADLIVVRENTEGLYRGVGYIDGDYHVNLRVFTTKGMDRILRFCFELARKEGRKKVTFTHKAHVLTYTDEPMRKMFYEIAKEYPNIVAEDMTIDACAMQVVMHPERFDIIFAENANDLAFRNLKTYITQRPEVMKILLSSAHHHLHKSVMRLVINLVALTQIANFYCEIRGHLQILYASSETRKNPAKQKKRLP